MKNKKNKKDKPYIEDEFIQFLKENSEEVSNWPAWKLEFLKSIENK